MSRRPILLALAALAARGQETYFKEPEKRPWIPAWQVEVRSDRIELNPTTPAIQRIDGRLRLRWELQSEDGAWALRVQTAHRVGSDGNRFNAARFDNEPSNGSNLDLAELRWEHFRPSAGLEVRGGLVENQLITSEALWDPDLRIVGGAGRAFWRSESASVEELGLRIEAGETRVLGGGKVRTRAAQGVLKFGWDPLSLAFFGGSWWFRAEPEDLARFSRQYPSNSYEYPLSETTYRSYGLEGTWNAPFPLEVRALRNEADQSHGWGEEFQAWAGPRNRAWWPRFGYVRQRLDPGGAMPAVSGDSWWFRINGDGQRYVASLGLPHRWSLSCSYVEQTRRASPAPPPVKRTLISIQKQF